MLKVSKEFLKKKKNLMNDHVFLISSCPDPGEAVHLCRLLLFFDI